MSRKEAGLAGAYRPVLLLLIGIALGALGAGALCIALFSWFVPVQPVLDAAFCEAGEAAGAAALEEMPADASMEPEQDPDRPLRYPPGFLIVTGERQDYRDGDMILYVPRLELELPVLDGADEATLARGIGLFDEAQLPKNPDWNSNTSIGGHRDVCNMEFYYIDTVEAGDTMYLTWRGTLFTYIVEDQFVTHDEDWTPVEVKEYPCLTLMSCEPVGVSSHRIFTVARMTKAEPGAGFPEG